MKSFQNIYFNRYRFVLNCHESIIHFSPAINNAVYYTVINYN